MQYPARIALKRLKRRRMLKRRPTRGERFKVQMSTIRRIAQQMMEKQRRDSRIRVGKPSLWQKTKNFFNRHTV